MNIILPDHHKGLNFLKGTWDLKKENPDLENFFDISNEALNSTKSKSLKITMPPFTIDTQLSVGKFMKNVSMYLYEYLYLNTKYTISFSNE